jgi:hypothetical protein
MISTFRENFERFHPLSDEERQMFSSSLVKANFKMVFVSHNFLY